MPAEQRLSDDDPRMIAWKAYQATPEYANRRKWARHVSVSADGEQRIEHPYLDGSLWALFLAGYQAGGLGAALPAAKKAAGFS